jgi:tubulin polyglutamylase TTLL4
VYYSKNLKEIGDLSYENCIDKLSPEDWGILFETDEENYRTGNFTRIFPVKNKTEHYLKFFEYPRYNNLIV